MDIRQSDYNNISGNTILNSGQLDAGTYYGIYLTDGSSIYSEYNRISNNYVIDNQAARTQDIGIGERTADNDYNRIESFGIFINWIDATKGRQT